MEDRKIEMAVQLSTAIALERVLNENLIKLYNLTLDFENADEDDLEELFGNMVDAHENFEHLSEYLDHFTK